MIKKILHPLIVSAFIFVMVLGSLVHICYGSSQTSKLHFIVQDHYMFEYLPIWMLKGITREKMITELHHYDEKGVMHKILINNYTYYLYVKKYSGDWREFHPNGNKRFIGTFDNGIIIEFQFWDDKGMKINLIKEDVEAIMN